MVHQNECRGRELRREYFCPEVAVSYVHMRCAGMVPKEGPNSIKFANPDLRKVA